MVYIILVGLYVTVENVYIMCRVSGPGMLFRCRSGPSVVVGLPY